MPGSGQEPLSDNASKRAHPFLTYARSLAYPPGIAITQVVLAANLLGERLATGEERPSLLRRSCRGRSGVRCRTVGCMYAICPSPTTQGLR